MRDKKGLFEVADGGTFFLDEVGDMSPALQVKLLRVLQEGTLHAGRRHPGRARSTCASSPRPTRTCGEMVKRGEFREDLYYRINVIRHAGAAAARAQRRPADPDRPLPAQAPRARGSGRAGCRPTRCRCCSGYPWPGNIRELENEIERLLVLGSDLEMLPARSPPASVTRCPARRATT